MKKYQLFLGSHNGLPNALSMSFNPDISKEDYKQFINDYCKQNPVVLFTMRNAKSKHKIMEIILELCDKYEKVLIQNISFYGTDDNKSMPSLLNVVLIAYRESRFTKERILNDLFKNKHADIYNVSTITLKVDEHYLQINDDGTYLTDSEDVDHAIVHILSQVTSKFYQLVFKDEIPEPILTFVPKSDEPENDADPAEDSNLFSYNLDTHKILSNMFLFNKYHKDVHLLDVVTSNDISSSDKVKGLTFLRNTLTAYKFGELRDQSIANMFENGDFPEFNDYKYTSILLIVDEELLIIFNNGLFATNSSAVAKEYLKFNANPKFAIY